MKTSNRVMKLLRDKMREQVKTKAEGKAMEQTARLYHTAFTHFDGNLSEL